MKKITFCLLGIAALGFARSAWADPYVITDQVQVAATNGTNAYSGYSNPTFGDTESDGRYWGQEIYGSSRYQTSQISVDRDAATDTVTFNLITMFSGSDPGASAHYADLFINTGDPANFAGPYSYGIALGDQTESAGVYAVSGYETSDDIWASQTSYVYGGYAQPDPSSPYYNPSIALAPPVRITSGTQLSNYTVDVSQTALTGGYYDVSVTLTSSTNIDLFNSFSVFWGTADCSNDAIWGVVPAAGVPTPASGLLLVAGVVALAATRRVARKTSIVSFA